MGTQQEDFAVKIATILRKSPSFARNFVFFVKEGIMFWFDVGKCVALFVIELLFSAGEFFTRPMRRHFMPPPQRHRLVFRGREVFSFPHLPSPSFLSLLALFLTFAYMQAPKTLAYAEDAFSVSAVSSGTVYERWLDLVFDNSEGPIKKKVFYSACKQAGIEDTRRCDFFWAVSMPESRRDRYAINVNMHQNSCGAGSVDVGVVQINISTACHQKRLRGSGDPFSLVPALRIANEIFSIQGCRAWSAYEKLEKKDRYCDFNHVPIPLSRPVRHQVMASH